MRIGDSTIGTETKRHEISPFSVLDAVDIHDLKILKQFSSTKEESTRPSLIGRIRNEISPSTVLDSNHIQDSTRLLSIAAEATRASPKWLNGGPLKGLKPCLSTEAEELDADHIFDSEILKQWSSTAAEATRSSVIDTTTRASPKQPPSPEELNVGHSKKSNPCLSTKAEELDAGHIFYSEISKQCSSTAAEATRPSVIDTKTKALPKRPAQEELNAGPSKKPCLSTKAEEQDADHILDSEILKRCSSTAAEAARPSLIGIETSPSLKESPCSSTAAKAIRPSLIADHIYDSKILKPCSSTTVEGTRPSIVSLLVSDPIQHSKRLKRSSSSAARPSYSNLMNISIDGLPEAVLLEILCRLPSSKYVAQCKCVSKRWCTLMSHPCFIRSFLRCQRDSDQMVRTLINRYGEEFLARLSSSRQALAPLFRRLMRSHCLEKEPVVVGAYNDLVLCCASEEYQRDYYICNPCTYQWLPLPPPPQVYKDFTPVGFICDLPYYQCKESDDDQKEGKHIQVNSGYRGRVVRIVPDRTEFIFKFKVQIYSTETGEWTESIVSSLGYRNDIHRFLSYPYNGMLYWMSNSGGEFLLGLDPFKITGRNTCTPGDYYKCHLITLEQPQPDKNNEASCPYNELSCLGEYRGCLQISNYNDDEDIITIWELNEEAISAEASKFGLVHTGVDYEPVWPETFPDDDEMVQVIALDPNDDGTMYLHIDKIDIDEKEGYICMFNMKTGFCSRICEKDRQLRNLYFFPLVLPCFPTPVPRRQAASIVSSQPSE